MLDSHLQATDALHSAIANLRGASDALCARASLEGDDLASMLSESIDRQVRSLAEVELWLESGPPMPAAEVRDVPFCHLKGAS